jgi:hypothetical protein
MDSASDDIVDQESHAAHAQRFSRESAEFVWSKVMHKEIAAYEIEGAVREGQSKCIASHSAVVAVQVAARAVEKGNGQVNTWGKAFSDFGGNKSCSGGDLEQGSALTAIFRERAADEFLACPHAAEPLIKHL